MYTEYSETSFGSRRRALYRSAVTRQWTGKARLDGKFDELGESESIRVSNIERVNHKR
jgi:hypothetical protein